LIVAALAARAQERTAAVTARTESVFDARMSGA
jgi:hypothetical protein